MSLPPWDTDPIYVAGDEPEIVGPTRIGTLFGCLIVIAVAAATIAVIALSVLAITAPRSAAAVSTGDRMTVGARPSSGAPRAAIGPGMGEDPIAGGAPLPAGGQIGTAIEGGWISQADPSHGSRYLAIRAERGTWVRICGPAACRTMVSTDYGPSSRIRPTRIADVALVVWRDICDLPDHRGLCEGSIEYVEAPELPATDTE